MRKLFNTYVCSTNVYYVYPERALEIFIFLGVEH